MESGLFETELVKKLVREPYASLSPNVWENTSLKFVVNQKMHNASCLSTKPLEESEFLGEED